jgi:primosomal protein N'
MVYQTVEVVYGFKIARRDLDEWVGCDGDKTDDDYYTNPENDQPLPSGVSVYSANHSDDKYVVVGAPVRKYYRVNAKCDKCDTYSTCDDCIGHTTGGWFDVVKMNSDYIVVDSELLCSECCAVNVTNFKSCKECAYPKSAHFHNRDFSRAKRSMKKVLPDIPRQFYLIADDCTCCS